MSPQVGQHFPRTAQEFHAWFATEEACRSYLAWLRWGGGFVCPYCGAEEKFVVRGDGRRQCDVCDAPLSVTAGTVFDKTRTPLSVWFAAGWAMTQQTTGISANGLRKELGLASMQTAWHMLHRYRAAMTRLTRPTLSGQVEVDETFVGGPRPGKRGRGADNKSIVVIALELKDPKGFGRVRMKVIPSVTRRTLHAFIRSNIEAGSVVVTDGLSLYDGIDAGGDYTHQVHNVKRSDAQAHELLPGVHRVASDLKRWITGTHKGAVSPEHLQSYLEEFTFRWNRRSSRHRGQLFYRLMQCAIEAPPIHYETLARIHRQKTKKPTPPVGGRPTRRAPTLGQPWLAVAPD